MRAVAEAWMEADGAWTAHCLEASSACFQGGSAPSPGLAQAFAYLLVGTPYRQERYLALPTESTHRGRGCLSFRLLVLMLGLGRRCSGPCCRPIPPILRVAASFQGCCWAADH